MNITIYNSLSKKKEIFKSIKKNTVSIYVCGPTTYDHLHIGNLRPMVVFDVLRRLLIYLKYNVTFVTNFTDIDDKIINKAIQENKTEKEISEFYINEINIISKNINCLNPSLKPRVTEYINEIIHFIDELVKKNYAYFDNNGNVLFNTKKINNYGELSNIKTDKLKKNYRNIKKNDNFDFVLWKKTDIGIKWNSPWGYGRPGWHTECCVMINKIFSNNKIDIHGGGFDLKFPHHENEIAQNKAIHKNKLANYWMHNGFIMIKNDKMSKSLKNIIFAKDIIEKYGGNTTRLFLIKTHYRSPLSFTYEKLNDTQKEMQKISSAYNKLAIFLQKNNIDIKNIQNIKIDLDNFLSALADDLNISLALSNLFDIVKNINVNIKNADINKCLYLFKQISDIFYLLGFKIDYHILTNEELKMFSDFEKAKNNKDFAKSDQIRKKLIEKGLL